MILQSGATFRVSRPNTQFIVVPVAGPPGPVGVSAVTSINGLVGAVTLGASDVGAQPVDTDLSAIALLTTTVYGRALLTMVDAAATRTILALGTAATSDTTAFAPAAGTTAALAAKADLVGGLVPTSQIPALALTTSVVVASQAAMLALTAAQVQPGDLAIRTDGAGTFILTAVDPSQLGNWSRLNAPTDLVSSVNGQIGAVTLAPSDVGAQPVDTDLTAIAALTTTAYGRSFLALADAAAGRTLLGLGTIATHDVTEFVQISNAAPLAQAGQTPSQAPVDPGTVADVGSLAFGARADHKHAFGAGPWGAEFFGPPPSYVQDYVIDGVNAYNQNNIYRNGSFGNFSGAVAYVGSVATWQGNPIVIARNFTLNAGITLKQTTLGRGILIVCSGVCTINGTILTDGESPAAGAAPAQTNLSSTFWSGFAAGTGNVGAGGAAGTATPADHPPMFGGQGNTGGASGGNAGGAATPNQVPSVAPWAVFPFQPHMTMYFVNGLETNNGQNMAQIYTNSAGGGGGGGAGDGTNKGGSGGGGAGHIVIVAPKIVIGSTAVLSAKGGNGAPGAGGNAAGGGGGGSGCIVMNGQSITIDPAAQLLATPGLGGAGQGTGANGLNANASNVVDPPVINGGRNKGAGVMINQWQ